MILRNKLFSFFNGNYAWIFTDYYIFTKRQNSSVVSVNVPLHVYTDILFRYVWITFDPKFSFIAYCFLNYFINLFLILIDNDWITFVNTIILNHAVQSSSVKNTSQLNFVTLYLIAPNIYWTIFLTQVFFPDKTFISINRSMFQNENLKRIMQC